MRIVAGEWSGRRLDPAPGTRPTAERTREALFSIWQSRVPGCRFLELFCGSGAAGLEALSRGAAAAVLIDAERRALAVASRNRDRLGAADCRMLRLTLPGGLGPGALRGELFDLVFADPPYDFEEWESLLGAIEPLLAADGEVVLEHASSVLLPDRVAALERSDSRRYGGSALSFYGRRSRGAAGSPE